jgi:hypothetical protein
MDIALIDYMEDDEVVTDFITGPVALGGRPRRVFGKNS